MQLLLEITWCIKGALWFSSLTSSSSLPPSSSSSSSSYAPSSSSSPSPPPPHPPSLPPSSSSPMALQSNKYLHLLNDFSSQLCFLTLFPLFNFECINICLYTISICTQYLSVHNPTICFGRPTIFY